MESGSDDNFDHDHLLAWKLCTDYMEGAWKHVRIEEMGMQRIR